MDCCRNDHKDANDVAMDVVMLSLRTTEGLDLKSFREAYGGSLVFLRGFLFSSSKEGILVTLQPQNDVILGFPSILMVLPNRGSQIVRDW